MDTPMLLMIAGDCEPIDCINSFELLSIIMLAHEPHWCCRQLLGFRVSPNCFSILLLREEPL